MAAAPRPPAPPSLGSDDVFQETSARCRAVEPSSGSNVIPRRARPGLAGLGPHTLPHQPRSSNFERLSGELRNLSFLRCCSGATIAAAVRVPSCSIRTYMYTYAILLRRRPQNRPVPALSARPPLRQHRGKSYVQFSFHTRAGRRKVTWAAVHPGSNPGANL